MSTTRKKTKPDNILLVTWRDAGQPDCGWRYGESGHAEVKKMDFICHSVGYELDRDNNFLTISMTKDVAEPEYGTLHIEKIPTTTILSIKKLHASK